MNQDHNRKTQSLTKIRIIDRLPRNIWILTIGSFLTDVSSEMLFNVLPLFLVNVLGAGMATVGLIEGIAESTSSFVKLFSGWLSDYLGGRKWLTVSDYSISTLAKPLLLIASSWWMILIARFADRIGKGIRTPPRDAMIADSVDESNSRLASGVHRAGDTAGAALGILATILIVKAFQGTSMKLDRSTFRVLVLISILPAALAVLVLVVGAKDTGITASKENEDGLWRRTLNPSFKRYLLAAAVFTLGNSSDAFIILRAQERGLSVVQILLMMLTFNLIYSATSVPAGALADRIGRKNLLGIAWLAYSLIYLSLGLASSSWQIWLLFTLYGIYFGASEGSSKAVVADLVEDSDRGTAYGLYSAAIGLLALPSSIIAGILWQGIGEFKGFGPGAPFIVGSILACAAALILSTVKDGKQKLSAAPPR